MLALQWRGIFVVIIILADVIYFSTVFLQFDGTTQKNETNQIHSLEWLLCMLSHDGDKNQCHQQASKLVVSEGIAFSVLFLLSVCSNPSLAFNPVILTFLPVQRHLGSYLARTT